MDTAAKEKEIAERQKKEEEEERQRKEVYCSFWVIIHAIMLDFVNCTRLNT